MLNISIYFKLFWNNLIIKFGKGYRFLFNISLIGLLEKLYPEGCDFIFIQIGANDGVSHDNIFDFVIKRNTKGILVEPLKDYYLKLCENYKKFPQIVKYNIALHPSEKEINLYRIKPEYENKLPEWAGGIASLNPNHHKKLEIPSEYIIAEVVMAKNFDDILTEFPNFKIIDLIQIDTEGFDYEILKMIDFKKYKIKFIKFEHINLTEHDYSEAIRKLKREGFIIFKQGNDTIALNKIQ